jgi:hypothetical protein
VTAREVGDLVDCQPADVELFGTVAQNGVQIVVAANDPELARRGGQISGSSTGPFDSDARELSIQRARRHAGRQTHAAGEARAAGGRGRDERVGPFGGESSKKRKAGA